VRLFLAGVATGILLTSAYVTVRATGSLWPVN
jgi:hypothetical protein